MGKYTIGFIIATILSLIVIYSGYQYCQDPKKECGPPFQEYYTYMACSPRRRQIWKRPYHTM